MTIFNFKERTESMITIIVLFRRKLEMHLQRIKNVYEELMAYTWSNGSNQYLKPLFRQTIVIVWWRNILGGTTYSCVSEIMTSPKIKELLDIIAQYLFDEHEANRRNYYVDFFTASCCATSHNTNELGLTIIWIIICYQDKILCPTL